MLFVRDLKKYSWFLLLAFGLLALISGVWDKRALITLPLDNGFFDVTERIVPFVLLLPISFLLYDGYEIELGLVCGVKTARLMLGRFFVLLGYAVCAMEALVVLYRYKEYFAPVEEIVIPIFIPEQYKLYMLVSVFVTTLFFASLFLFLRVLLKNCYAPVGLGIFAYSTFYTLNYNIRAGSVGIKSALFDPLISGYLLGDTVPVEHYGIGPLWTYNRILFFCLAAGMLIAIYVLLRREQLHQGFHD
ncbi:MAG: hypothetical protein IJB88_04765 [Clostridia bacterium]|nr:hypothetical protein [Clostridia bacterium]